MRPSPHDRRFDKAPAGKVPAGGGDDVDLLAQYRDGDAQAFRMLVDQYRDRMLQMRARSFCLRDQFADVLKGMPVAEEVMDIPTEREVGPSRPTQTATEPEALPPYPEAQLDANSEGWARAIAAHKTVPDHLINTISSKYTLSDEQKDKIRKLAPIEGEAANASS